MATSMGTNATCGAFRYFAAEDAEVLSEHPETLERNGTRNEAGNCYLSVFILRFRAF